ncbi:hypothetical protein [Saccharomonospora cyanea]|uniref:Nitrogen fixation protein NifU n=1 Tax=Saccharomonospora cyanea NA-134 TaxID=882082 RepID=H5XLH9_9PSEU|nr:hypothetical protein [Saccharomonospora cyanea]EHR59848.1 hypothetical protein SaccyDRAFT_0935 [Saccharomonospora cyanea NA-134]
MAEAGKWDIERVRRRLAELDGGLAELSERAEERTLDTVRALVDVYGEALARVVALAGQTAPELLDALSGDELLAQLLLVHDLHPQDPVTRIRRALAELRPRIVAELTDYDGGVATVSVEGGHRGGGNVTGRGGENVTETTETVAATVRAVAPEVTDVSVRLRTEPAFVPLAAVRAR